MVNQNTLKTFDELYDKNYKNHIFKSVVFLLTFHL